MTYEFVSMHQPNYLPWIGLFSKIALTHRFVIMDTFQYTRHGVTHRNKIRTNVGSKYLTIPIDKRFATSAIKDVELPREQDWKRIHWQSIYQNYIRAGFFRDYMEFFERLYQRSYRFLWEFNMDIIRYMLKCFRIDVDMVLASQLDLPPTENATDTIISVLKRTGANTYVSGPSGKNYLELSKFRENDMECLFCSFQHPVYIQRYPDFESNLSAIDLLFNTGRDAAEIIKNSGSIEAYSAVEKGHL